MALWLSKNQVVSHLLDSFGASGPRSVGHAGWGIFFLIHIFCPNTTRGRDVVRVQGTLNQGI